MTWTQAPSLGSLEQFLDLSAYRHSLVTSNLANIDTPRYRALDIDFAAEMRRADTQMGANAQPIARQVEGLIERPDGNNVSLERETLLLAETQLQFRVAVDLLRAEFRRVRTAIHGGTGQ